MAACRPLTLADVEPAARVISQAFADDPLAAFMLPHGASRAHTLYKFFLILGELSIRAGRGYGAGHPLQGVAYWKAPDQESLSISIKSVGKLLPLLLTYYPIGYIRGRGILARIDELHEKHAAEPHYYLDNLGILPTARGQGLSSALIRPFLDLADEQGVAVYTDTVTAGNVPFYEHFGFRCAEASPVSGSGITVYAMLRMKTDPKGFQIP